MRVRVTVWLCPVVLHSGWIDLGIFVAMFVKSPSLSWRSGLAFSRI